MQRTSTIFTKVSAARAARIFWGFLYELIRAERAAFLHVQTRFLTSGEVAYTCRFICCGQSGGGRSRRKRSNPTGEEVKLLNGMSFEEWIG